MASVADLQPPTADVAAAVRPPALPWLVGGLAALLLVSLTLAVTVGSVAIRPGVVWQIVGHELLGVPGADGAVGQQRPIVWELRLPRALLAALVGAGLAVVGVAIQALVRNPLADPYILGVSAGASVGATLVILFGALAWLGFHAVSLAAFAGAAGAMALVYAVAQSRGALSPLRLVLAGVTAGYVLSGVTSFLVFQSDARAAQSVLFWLLGSFGRAQWAYLPVPAVALAAGTLYLVARSRGLNLLLLGDETAGTLGVHVARFRAALFVVTAAMTGVMVAVAGAIGFVGLVMPHVARLLVGADHRRVLPVAALLGAVLMVWVDVLARIAVTPQELPVGVVTALIGGPCFVWLMRRRTAEGGP